MSKYSWAKALAPGHMGMGPWPWAHGPPPPGRRRRRPAAPPAPPKPSPAAAAARRRRPGGGGRAAAGGFIFPKPKPKPKQNKQNEQKQTGRPAAGAGFTTSGRPLKGPPLGRKPCPAAARRRRPGGGRRASESVARARKARAVGCYSKFRDVSSKFREEMGVPGVPGVPRCSARVPAVFRVFRGVPLVFRCSGVPRVPRCSVAAQPFLAPSGLPSNRFQTPRPPGESEDGGPEHEAWTSDFDTVRCR